MKSNWNSAFADFQITFIISFKKIKLKQIYKFKKYIWNYIRFIKGYGISK